MSEEPVVVEEGITIEKVNLSDLREQDLNPRTMSTDMMRQLTENIANREGLVESLPFCARTDKGIEIVSGHHRIRAAIAAGVESAYVIVDATGLTRDQIKAKQIAHNSISGMDDKELLKRLFESIEDVDARIEAFVNPADLDIQFTENEIPDLSAEIEHKQVYMLFVPSEYKVLREAIDQIWSASDEILLADKEHFEQFRDALTGIQEEKEILSVATAIAKMAELALEQMAQEDT